jgi:hypothetical protein
MSTATHIHFLCRYHACDTSQLRLNSASADLSALEQSHHCWPRYVWIPTLSGFTNGQKQVIDSDIQYQTLFPKTTSRGLSVELNFPFKRSPDDITKPLK